MIKKEIVKLFSIISNHPNKVPIKDQVTLPENIKENCILYNISTLRLTKKASVQDEVWLCLIECTCAKWIALLS